MKNYANLGDVNFFDYGVLVRDLGGDDFEVIKCTPDCDKKNNYLFSIDIINTNDSWIDKEEVQNHCGETDNKMQLVSNIAFYYGPQDSNYNFLTKNQIIDIMNEEEYLNFLEWDFYEDNFTDNNRNCTIKVNNEIIVIDRPLEDAREEIADMLEVGAILEIMEA